MPSLALSTVPLLLLALSSNEHTSLAFQNPKQHNARRHNFETTRTPKRQIITSKKSSSLLSPSPIVTTTQLYMADEDKGDDVELDRILFDDISDDLDDAEFLKRQMAHLENMEKMLDDIDEYCGIEGMCEDDDAEEEMDMNDEDLLFMGDVDELEDMESLFDFLEENAEEFGIDDEKEEEEEKAETTATSESATDNAANPFKQSLEEALLQGVVPVDAGVGSNNLPGDFGWDPLGIADKDYMQQFQYQVLNALPGGNPDNDPPPEPRPSALVLRDYREAEIRHGRLAMLAVVIWPIQEKIDQLLLEPKQCGPLLYGPITLPYLPLFMTLLLMLLGYLDIYTKDIQEADGVGDAFLPGDCFWDPLKVLDGAPASMKRNMQERELFNGRVAMLAFAAFVFEEATSHEAVIDIPSNEFLFVPAYQIPSVQEWLDSQFLIYDK